MGICLTKPDKKINPLPSNGQVINGKIHGKNCENSETNILGSKTSKHTSTDIDNNSEVHEEHHGKISEAKTRKIRSEITKISSADSGIPQDALAVCTQSDNEERNFSQVSPRARLGLPTKAVRFDIDLSDTVCQYTSRKFPRRLKKLEGIPQLTAEQLRKKQELAEDKREKELQRKAETLSKRHRDLFQARESERLRNAQVQMEQKFLTNERNRENHMKEVINKQREREKKAKKVREKLCVELEESVIHVDETYNSDGNSEDEDWGGEQQNKRSATELLKDDDSTDEFYESSGTQWR